MFADIVDAGSSVAIEQESKNLTDKVIVDLAFLYILVALGASVKAFFLATLSDLAPGCFLILLASRAFAI
jgi:hypothetical protein